MKKGGKATPAPSGKGGFNAADWASKTGVSEAEIAEYKQAFDLFDTDQGGSIDTKGTCDLK